MIQPKIRVIFLDGELIDVKYFAGGLAIGPHGETYRQDRTGKWHEVVDGIFSSVELKNVGKLGDFGTLPDGQMGQWQEVKGKLKLVRIKPLGGSTPAFSLGRNTNGRGGMTGRRLG